MKIKRKQLENIAHTLVFLGSQKVDYHYDINVEVKDGKIVVENTAYSFTIYIPSGDVKEGSTEKAIERAIAYAKAKGYEEVYKAEEENQ